jgi:TP901 family phage tail tape measure protein
MSDMLLAMMLTLKDMASGPLGQAQNNVKKFSHELLAIGAASRAAGQKILGAMQAPIAAFAEAEDAATRLRISMMDSSGVSKGFEAVNKLATDLGNKLPGTTADFQEMMTALNQQGISAQSILGGVGKSAAYLGVQLKMPYRDAAIFAAHVGKAAGVAAKDMEKFMDVIQRTANLGVETGQMEYAFGRSAGALKAVGLQGLESAKSLSIMFAKLIENGLSGETVGTNFAGMLDNLKKYQYGIGDKATGAKNSLKALGIEMQFFDKQGKMAGPREMIAQLEKLKKLAPDKRAKAMDDLFGGGQDKQMVDTLVLGGVAEYDKMAKKAKDQADLNTKVEAQLRTLKNIWDSATGTFTNMLATLGESIAPELKAMADGFGKLAEQLQKFAKEHPQITKMATAFTLLSGAALVVGGTAAMGLGMALPVLGHAATGVGKVAGAAGKMAKHGKDAALSMKIWNASAGANMVAAANKPIPMPKFSTMFKSAFTSVGNAAKSFGSSIAGSVGKVGRLFTAMPGALMKLPGVIGGAFGKIPGLLTRIPMLLRAVALGIRAVGLAAIGNPVGLVIAGIALAAVLVFKYWKPIAGFFKGLWQGLMIGLKPLKPAFDAAFAAVAPIIQPIVGALKGVWNWVKSLLSPVNDTGGAAEKMGKKFGLALAEMISKGQEMLAHFMALPEKLLSIGTNMMMGLLNGITAGAGRVLAKIGEIANSIKSKFAGIMGIQSPSRVFMGFGQNLGAGLELGMVAKAAGIAGAAKKLAIAATPNMPKLAGSGLALSPARAGAGSGGHQFTFAPTIQLMAAPGSGVQQQLDQGLRLSYNEFQRLMDRYSHDKKRANA